MLEFLLMLMVEEKNTKNKEKKELLGQVDFRVR